MKTLEARKIIQGYRLSVKSFEHKPFGVLISFQNYSKEQEEKLSGYLAQLKPVTQVVNLFGQWSMFLHLRAKDHEELQDVLIDIRNKFSIIDTTEKAVKKGELGLFEEVWKNKTFISC